MREKYKIVQLSPMIPTRDMEVTKNFLIEAFGFDISLKSPEYVVLTRDGFDIHLSSAGDNVGQMSVYLEVDDLELAWKKCSSVSIEGIRVREPFEQAYGMKEFHIDLPMTEVLLFVGQKCVQDTALKNQSE